MDTQTNTSFFWRWLPLTILCLAVFITALDSTLLNVAIPTMVVDLHTTIDKLQWVISAYSLVLAAFTITGGRLGDFWGRKSTFVIGAILFAIGSFIASISHSVSVLIAGESIIEGFGAALMVPATATLILANYSGRSRAIAFGVYAAFASVAVAVGPILGGFFTTNYTWRYGFRINVVVVAILLIGSFFLKNSKDTEEKPSLDWGGVFFSAVGLFLIVFGIIESSDFGWWHAKKIFTVGSYSLPLFGNISVVAYSFALGILFLAAFMLWEFRRERKGKTPLVSLRIFRNIQFSSGLLITFLVYMGFAGVTFLLPVFFQSVKSLSAFDIGLSLLPYSITILIGSQLSSYLVKYITPKRLIIIGLFFSAIGLTLLRQELTLMTTIWGIALGISINGIGIGMVAPQFTNLTLSAVSVQESGEASGLFNTIKQIGLSFAIAISGSVLIAGIGTNLVSGIGNNQVIPADQKQALVSTFNSQGSDIEFGSQATRETALNNFSPTVIGAAESITEQSVLAAARKALLFNIGFVVVSFFAAFILEDKADIEEGISVASGH